MAETLVAVAVGAVSAALGWAVARWSGPAGTTRYRVVLLASFLAFLTLGSSILVPRARSWQQERDVDALLRNEPLFVAVVEDEPSLRAPLRAALLTALRVGPKRRGPPGRAAAAEPAALALRAARLRRRGPRPRPGPRGDPDATCRRATRSSAIASSSRPWPGRRAAGPRPGTTACSRRCGPWWRPRATGRPEPLDRRAARKELDAAFGRLRERHGSDVDVLRNAQAPGAIAPACAR